MKLNLDLEKQVEPITTSISLPVSESRKERYYRVLNQLHQKKKKGLHDFARERIDQLLDEVEAALAAS